jgi:peptidoglycan/LPS O-acetylase OafA/YrhL
VSVQTTVAAASPAGGGASARAASVRRPPLRALTGLRFVAAFHVVAYHLAPRPQGDGVARWLRNVIDSGYVGVSLFFVLSGAVLAYNYSGDEAPRESGTRRAFWLARFARVYPVYLLSLVVTVPVMITYAAYSAQRAGSVSAAMKVAYVALANLGLLQGWLVNAQPQWNGPGWSLSAEAFFYLLFPSLVLRLQALPRRRMVATVAALLVAALIAPALYVAHDGWAHGYARDGRLSLQFIKYAPILRLPEFALGILVGRALLEPTSLGARTARARPLIAWCATAVTLVVLANSSLVPLPVLHDGLLALPFAALIYGLSSESGALARVLASAPAVLLGEASYAMYLLHLSIFAYVRLAWPALPRTGWGFAVASLLAVLVSVGVLYTFEEPARRFVRRSLSS